MDCRQKQYTTATIGLFGGVAAAVYYRKKVKTKQSKHTGWKTFGSFLLGHSLTHAAVATTLSSNDCDANGLVKGNIAQTQNLPLSTPVEINK